MADYDFWDSWKRISKLEQSAIKSLKIIKKLDFETLSKNTKNSLRYLYVARKK